MFYIAMKLTLLRNHGLAVVVRKGYWVQH